MGAYKARMKSLEVKPNSKGNGTIGATIFEITEGVYAPKEIDGEMRGGMTVRHFFNITNANPKAEEISEKQLNNLLLAVGARASMESLGHDIDKLIELVGDREFIIEVDRVSDFKDKEGKFLKVDAKRRKELDSLTVEELIETGVEKVLNNKIKSFKAA